MSMFWKKGFRYKIVSAVEPDGFDLFVANKYGILPKVDFCPCVNGWYIATFCACELCENSKTTNWIGRPAVFPSFFENGYPHDFAGEPVYDVDGNPVCCVDFDADKVAFNILPMISEVENSVVFAVRHKTPSAPYDCEINATLRITGPLAVGDGADPFEWAGEMDAVSCEVGTCVHLGASNYYTHYDHNAREQRWTDMWDVRYQMPEGTGTFNLDLTVTMQDINNPDAVPFSYSIRQPIVVLDVGENMGNGSVAILPDYAISEGSCAYSSLNEQAGERVSLSASPIKGPFKTKAMAEEVYTEFKGLIDEYARLCACTVGRDRGTAGGRITTTTSCPFYGVQPNPMPEFITASQIDGECFGSSSDEPALFFAGPSIVEWYSEAGGWEYKLIRFDKYGRELGPWSGGILQPCERAEVRLYLNGQWEGSPAAEYHADETSLNFTTEKCPFCGPDRWDFDAHAWHNTLGSHCKYVGTTFIDGNTTHLSVWGYTPAKDNNGTPYGIPGNTEQYLDWTGEVPIVDPIYPLLGELPEGLA